MPDTNIPVSNPAEMLALSHQLAEMHTLLKSVHEDLTAFKSDTTKSLAKLERQQSATTKSVEELNQQQSATNESLRKLNQQQSDITKSLKELNQQQSATTKSVEELRGDLATLKREVESDREAHRRAEQRREDEFRYLVSSPNSWGDGRIRPAPRSVVSHNLRGLNVRWSRR